MSRNRGGDHQYVLGLAAGADVLGAPRPAPAPAPALPSPPQHDGGGGGLCWARAELPSLMA